MRLRSGSPLAKLLLLAAIPVAGCSQKETYTPLPEPILQPVKGRVTAEGKPLAGAVVTFLQTDEKGTTAVAETDEDGDYELSHLNKPGAAAAHYKVAISYLVGTDGTIYGLGPRSGLAKPYGMLTAKERIVPEWSDLGRTQQEATVPVNGGTFDFDIKEPLLPVPAPAPSEAVKPDPAKSESAKSSEPSAKTPQAAESPQPIPSKDKAEEPPASKPADPPAAPKSS